MNIILGTAQFGLDYGVSNTKGQVALSEVKKIIARANSLNINHFDTAQVYGESETILGGILGEKACITTKIPPRTSDEFTDTEWIRSNIKRSLTSLERAGIDELLFHRVDDLLRCDELKVNSLFKDLKRTGLINKVGVSLYNFDQIKVLLQRFEIDIVQVPFNILDSRLIHDDWLTFFNSKGIRVDVRSIFLQGLLIIAGEKKHSYFDRWGFIFDELVKFKNGYPDMSYLELCVRFIKQYPSIDNIVVGVQSEKELIELAHAFNIHHEMRIPDFSCRDTDLINPASWDLS